MVAKVLNRKGKLILSAANKYRPLPKCESLHVTQGWICSKGGISLIPLLRALSPWASKIAAAAAADRYGWDLTLWILLLSYTVPILSAWNLRVYYWDDKSQIGWVEISRETGHPNFVSFWQLLRESDLYWVASQDVLRKNLWLLRVESCL